MALNVCHLMLYVLFCFVKANSRMKEQSSNLCVLISVADEPVLCLTGFQARLSRLHGNQEASEAGLQGSTSQGFSDRLGRQSQDSHE